MEGSPTKKHLYHDHRRETGEIIIEAGGTTLTASAPSTTTSPPAFNHHEQNNNPMLNELILKKLFDKCSSHLQLNQYRRVCKRWYNVSLPLWLSTGPPVIFHDYDMMLKFFSDVHLNSTLPDDLEDVVQGIQRYRKFIMEPNKLQNGRRRRRRDSVFDHSSRSRSFELFWTKCGPWLTHLTLRRICFTGVENVVKEALLCDHTPNLQYLEVDVDSVSGGGGGLIPNNIQNDLPAGGGPGPGIIKINKNLKTLRIDWRRSRGEFHPIPFPLNWKTLFEHYPNLKDLGIGCSLSIDQSEMMRIIQAITDIRSQDANKLALNSLIYFYNENHKEPHDSTIRSTTFSLPHALSDLLRQASLKLEQFRLDFSLVQSDDYIHRVISLYSETLAKLQIHYYFPFETFPVRGFKALQQLTLTKAPVKDLTFLSEIPGLRSLRLYYGYRAEEWEGIYYLPELISLIATTGRSWQNGEEFHSISEFCCNYPVEWTRDDVALLGKWFPSISRLEMSLNNSTFRLVCEQKNWSSNLEHLTVYGDKVGDKGIAGLAWEEDQLVYKRPNITCLQKLRSFAINDLGRYVDLREEGAFSQHSVLYGFLKLPQLENLAIKVMKMEPELKELILKRIPFAKITTKED